MNVDACPFDHPMEWDREHYRAYGMKYKARPSFPFTEYGEWRFSWVKGEPLTPETAERIIAQFTRAIMAEVREKGGY